MEQRSMAGSSLSVLEETKNMVMADLDLTLKAVRTLQVSRGTHAATRRTPLLAHIRQLLRIDLSTIDLSPTQDAHGRAQLLLMFLKGVLTYHREVAAHLERFLQINDPLRRNRIHKLIGSRQEIETVLEALEDKIEDLEIATSPEVHAAIERLIDEAKAP
jgi:hypothetical protein